MSVDAAAARRAEAMVSYVLQHVGPAVPLDPAALEALAPAIRSLREETRLIEGGSAASGPLVAALATAYGWNVLSTTYLCPAGGVIEIEHHVAVFADGTILDAAADAHGEGFDVRVMKPSDPAYGRYRPEFEDDWNPGNDPVRLGGWAFEWTGIGDEQARGTLREARGYGWWVDDTAALEDFVRTRRDLAAKAGDGGTAMEMALHLQDLAARGPARVYTP